MHLIPAEWVTAQKVLRGLSLSLRSMDQSGFAEGDISLSHVRSICNHRGSQAFTDITGVSLCSFCLKDVCTLKDVGEWLFELDNHICIAAHPHVLDKT